MPNWMQSSFGKVFLINVSQTQRLKSSSFDEYINILRYMNFQHMLSCIFHENMSLLLDITSLYCMIGWDDV